MRPGQQKQRGRGRNNNGGGNQNNNQQRKGQNPLTRTYDSSGPDVKIRGTAQHIAEKYMALARDATSSGDRVMAENYLQHAEHYNRIIAAAQAMFQERFQRDDRMDAGDRDEDDGDNGNVGGSDVDGDSDLQPQLQPQQHQQRHQPQNQRPPRQQHVAEQPQPVIIDQSTPQPVFEDTPAEVQIEQEAAVEGQAERAPRRRSNAGRPRRTPRLPRGETAEGEAPAPAPVDVPAE
jgi:hypothetical protein